MIETSIITDIGDHALKASWERLFALNGYCYQNSYNWCLLWMKHFGGSKRKPFVVVAKENGRTIGIGPFMIERRRFLSELKFIGSGLTDFHEILPIPGRDREVLRAILDRITKKPLYDLINLEQMSDHRRSSGHAGISPDSRPGTWSNAPSSTSTSGAGMSIVTISRGRVRHEWSKKLRRSSRERAALGLTEGPDAPGKSSALWMRSSDFTSGDGVTRKGQQVHPGQHEGIRTDVSPIRPRSSSISSNSRTASLPMKSVSIKKSVLFLECLLSTPRSSAIRSECSSGASSSGT